MRGRLHHVVLNCPDPMALATFYSRLLDEPITYESEGWVVVSADTETSGLAFQRAPSHRPAQPQQIHLDVMVEDVAAATLWVLGLGATPDGRPDVFTDPAGHPFCLIKRPTWAAPLA